MVNFTDSKTKIVTKGTLLLRSGEICKSGYAVQKGCLKSYVVDKAGKEHVIQFAPENWIVSDMNSAINQEPSVIYIEAIEDSEILVLPVNQFSFVPEMDKSILVDALIKLRNNLIATNKRLIALLSTSAEERYIDFTQTYPTLVQRLPLKLIASYIGITPEYLSEIRRKIAGK